MSLKKVFINLAVLGLLIFGFMSFIIITQGNNSVSEPLGDHELFNETYGNLYGNLSVTGSNSETASDSFGSADPPTQNLGELGVGSVASTTRIFKAMSNGLFKIYVYLPIAILKVDPIVATVISSILMLLLILGAWAVWKGVVS